MRKLVWDVRFKRALKRKTRRQPALQERVFEVLDVLVENPFETTLKTHRLEVNWTVYGRAGLNMIAALFLHSNLIRMAVKTPSCSSMLGRTTKCIESSTFARVNL